MCLLLLPHYTVILECLIYADLCYLISLRTSNVLTKPLLTLLLEEEGNEIAINFCPSMIKFGASEVYTK